MPTDDLKDLAKSGKDFYAVLGLDVAAGDSPAESEIRRAYRKLALKLHPDKNNGSTVEQFHQLQVAFDVLSDPEAKAMYDHDVRIKRQARERDEERRKGWTQKQKRFADALEKGEREGTIKRARTGDDEEESRLRQKQQISQLRQDIARKAKEKRQSMMQEEAEELANSTPARNGAAPTNGHYAVEVDGMDKAIMVRWFASDDDAVDAGRLKEVFGRFGDVELVQMRKPKRERMAGSDHKVQIGSASVVFASIASTYAAVDDAEKVKADGLPSLANVDWLRGQVPGVIKSLEDRSVAAWEGRPDPPDDGYAAALTEHETTRIRLRMSQRRQQQIKRAREAEAQPAGKVANGTMENEGNQGIRKVPSFASFKGTSTPQRAPAPKFAFSATNTPTTESPADAERRRKLQRMKLEEEIRRREAEEDEANG